MFQNPVTQSQEQINRFTAGLPHPEKDYGMANELNFLGYYALHRLIDHKLLFESVKYVAKLPFYRESKQTETPETAGLYIVPEAPEPEYPRSHVRVIKNPDQQS